MGLGEGRAALERGDFDEALRALAGEAPGGDEGYEWLERRADAAYGAGAYDDAITAWEELHRRHRAAGDRTAAARAAVMTAMFLLIDSGLMSAVRGWTRRAERMLEGDDDTPVHALISAVRTYERFMSGDMGAAADHAARAVELGERHQVTPAVVIGRTALGRTTILGGDVDSGLVQLDEVAALLMSGDVDPLTTGMMYCEIVCAAQGLGRAERAREWTDAMERWCPERAFGGLHGRCRVHRAELLRLSGPADDAERVALQACAELRPWMRREFGWPLVELGTIRLRKGDLAGAEEALLSAADHGWPLQPGLALLRLEQGETGTAAALIADAVAHPAEGPSKEMPPFGDLRLAPLLDAQAEIAAVSGDRDALHAAAASLAQISARYGSPLLVAGTSLAAARLALVDGDPATAVERARHAVAELVALDACFDVGRARAVLADALELGGDVHGADQERAAARQAYLTYGATRRAAELSARIDARSGRDAPAKPAPTSGPTGVFQADGPTWRIELAGRRASVKDLKGIRYLHRLVAEPGREFHVLDLVAVENGVLPVAEDLGPLPTQRGESGIPVLDDAAREAYRRRLVDVEDDIEEATRLNDLGRRAKAEADREYLILELSRAVGLGGRQRVVGSSSERARTSVARSVRYALAELDRCHPPAADHLRSSVRTGTYCAYQPDPLARVDWDL